LSSEWLGSAAAASPQKKKEKKDTASFHFYSAAVVASFPFVEVSLLLLSVDSPPPVSTSGKAVKCGGRDQRGRVAIGASRALLALLLLAEIV
jgi:hypothetical protein